jgi:hypothetical protein
VKKILYTLPLVLLVFSLMFTTGCKKEDEIITPVDENVDKEAVTASNLTYLEKIITDASSSSILLSTGVTPSGSGSCPFLYDSLNSFLVADFGMPPGCVSPVDGVRRSGLYNIDYTVVNADSMKCTILFSDFRVYKSSSNADTNLAKINGTISFTIKKVSSSTYTLQAKGEAFFINQSGTIKEVYVDSLSGSVNVNSISNPFDDSYSLHGGQRIKDNQFNITYTVFTPVSSPLNYISGCKYPVTGIMNLTNSGTSCDFSPNSGACDAITKFSKGSTNKTVDLSGVNF